MYYNEIKVKKRKSIIEKSLLICIYVELIYAHPASRGEKIALNHHNTYIAKIQGHTYKRIQIIE